MPRWMGRILRSSGEMGKAGALGRKNSLSQGLDWDLRGRTRGVVGRNSGGDEAV